MNKMTNFRNQTIEDSNALLLVPDNWRMPEGGYVSAEVRSGSVH